MPSAGLFYLPPSPRSHFVTLVKPPFLPLSTFLLFALNILFDTVTFLFLDIFRRLSRRKSLGILTGAGYWESGMGNSIVTGLNFEEKYGDILGELGEFDLWVIRC